MTLTRGQKLWYGALLSACFLIVAAVDDSAEQEERAQAHREWLAEQAVKNNPNYISSPDFSGEQSIESRYQEIRERHLARRK